MALTTLIKRQLWVFAALTFAALSLTAFRYVNAPALVGIGVYDVTVEFGDASGLYPQAQVTYRGVEVGEVTDLDVSPDGAVATLRLDSDVPVPADAVAELHSTSAIGEQYVDLLAEGGDAPFLAEGDAIPRSRAVEMPQITPALESLNRLMESVPRNQTRRVLTQLGHGFGRADRDLAGLIDSSDKFLTEAHANVDATTSYIAALKPVLRTQQHLAPSTRAYAAALSRLTGTLAAEHSADVRALLEAGPGGLDQLTRLATDLQPTLPMLAANLTTNADVLNTYLPHLRQTLVVYPATADRLQSAVNPRADMGDVQLDLRITFGDPPSCQSGYLPVDQRRSPSDRTSREVDLLAHCKIPADHPTAVRGARNLPCPDSAARGSVPRACGLTFGRGQWPADGGAVARDLVIGRGGDNSTDLAGDSAAPEGDELWKILVLEPLGVLG